jgi:FkbM family methyltransferase
MKQGVLSSIRHACKLLPIKVRHVLIKSLIDDQAIADRHGFDYLSILAPRLNISGVEAEGDYGPMSSTPHDATIFKKYAKTGKWAAELTERLESFFAGSDGVYLDIGANIGMTVVPLARSNPRVDCHAFEPEPTNYRNLVRNIRENCSSDKIKTYQVALHKCEAVLPFEITTGNLGDQRLHADTAILAKQGEEKRKLIEVPCKTLDGMAIRKHGRMFVKVDTQGAEPFIVEGGRNTLAQADAILFEWSPYLTARLNTDPDIVLRFVEDNFKSARIEQTDLRTAQVSESEGLRPAGEIADQLRSTIKEWRDTPTNYIDLFVTK